MASEQQLLDALMKADQAGDTTSAQAFAAEIKRMRAAGGQAPSNAVASVFDTPEYKAMMNTDMPDPTREIEKARTIRQGNEAPEYLKPVIAASDIASNIADSASFGNVDKLAAYLSSLTGKNYDEQLATNRKQTQAAEDRAGWAGTAAKVTGALKSGELAARAGLTLSGRLADASTPLLRRLAAATVTSGIEGGAYGGLDAQGHDKDIAKGAEDSALFGMGLGPIAESLASAKGAILSKIRGTNAAPTAAELEAAKNAAYKTSEDMGAAYSPATVNDMMNRIRANTVNAKSGAREVIHPKTVDKVDQMHDDIEAPATPISMYDMDAQRKGVRRDLLGANAPDEEQHFGRIIRNEIDDTMADVDPSKVTTVNGTPQEAIDALLSARGLNSRLSKVEDLQDILAKANRSVDASASGTTSGQQIRQGVARLLNSESASRGYTPSEISQLEDVVRGSRFANTMRSVGGFMRTVPGRAMAGSAGAGLGGMLMPGTTGLTLGSMAGIGAGDIAGRLAAGAANRATTKGMQKVIDEAARGRPITPTRTQNSMTPKEVTDAVRMLMLMKLQDPSSRSN
jgi:hypothetical protein